MNRSTLPIGLLGVTSFASTFHVRSPQVRNRNGPNATRRLRLLALSLESSGCGWCSSAYGLRSPVLGSTSPLAVMVLNSRGVVPERHRTLSPTLSLFHLFCPPP